MYTPLNQIKFKKTGEVVPATDYNGQLAELKRLAESRPRASRRNKIGQVIVTSDMDIDPYSLLMPIKGAWINDWSGKAVENAVAVGPIREQDEDYTIPVFTNGPLPIPANGFGWVSVILRDDIIRVRATGDLDTENLTVGVPDTDSLGLKLGELEGLLKFSVIEETEQNGVYFAMQTGGSGETVHVLFEAPTSGIADGQLVQCTAIEFSDGRDIDGAIKVLNKTGTTVCETGSRRGTAVTWAKDYMILNEFRDCGE